jgi:hypothetical protein
MDIVDGPEQTDTVPNSFEVRSQLFGTPIKIAPSVSLSGFSEWIFIKFDVGEFYKQLSSHFNLHLDQAILTTTLQTSIFLI